MFSNLEGKTVLITGGSGGIGKSIVSLLLKYKLNVAFTHFNNKVDIATITGKLPGDIGRIKQYKLNLENKEEIREVVKQVERDFNTINFLINNAGIIKDAFMVMMSDQSWEKVLTTNLTGAFLITREVLPIMMANNYGAIINISSTAGISGVIGQTNYCSAKAGLIGFTKALAREVAYKNIRVNAIAPGYVDTDMISGLDLKLKESFNERIPLKRIALADEIASVVLFLLSDGASYITGTTIIVDGGLTS